MTRTKKSLQLLLAALCLAATARTRGDETAAGPGNIADRLAHWFSAEVRSVESRRKELLGRLAGLPLPPVEQQSQQIGYHSRFRETANDPAWITIDLGKTERMDALVLVPCNVAYGTHGGPGYGFPARFKVEIGFDPALTNAMTIADHTTADFPSPGDLPVYLPAEGRAARYIRVTATKLWSRGDSFLFALGEVMALQGNRNIAAGAGVTASHAYDNPPAWRVLNATDGQSALGAPVLLERTPGNGYHSIENSKEQNRVGWVQVDLGRSHEINEVRLFPARPNDFPARRGFGFPLRFLIEAAEEPDFRNAIVIVDHREEDFLNPAENPVSFPAENVRGRYVRVTATKWWHRNQDYVFALAEMAVYAGDENVALGAPVLADTKTEFWSWKDEFLVDGYTSQGRIVEWPSWVRGLSERREVLQQLAAVQMQHQRLVSTAVLQAGVFAIALIAIALLALLVLAYRARLKRHREVDMLRARIAADLHDEIGSNVGSIALLARIMQSDRKITGESQQTLQDIQRTATQTLDSMREIVWLIHPGHDRLDELVDRLREFSRNMLAGVNCSFEVPPGSGVTRLSLDTRRNLYLIFKELMHNIAKHSGAKRVNISITEKENGFEMVVADDGVGFDTEQKPSGHGLDNLRRRVEKLGGEIWINSRPGEGTRVSLRLQVA